MERGKRLLCHLLSWCLLTVGLASPLAYAQDPPPEPQQQSQNSGGLVSNGGSQTEVDGRDLPLYINALNLLVMVFIGFSALLYCGPVKRPSLVVYWLASVFYIIAEIYAFTNYQEESDKTMRFDYQGDYLKQKESFQKAKDITEKARKYLEKKVLFYQILAGAFGVAAAVALAESLSLITLEPLVCNIGETPVTQIQMNPTLHPEWLENQIMVAESDYDAMTLIKEHQAYERGENQSISLDEYKKWKDEDVDFKLPFSRALVAKLASAAGSLLGLRALAQGPDTQGNPVDSSVEIGNEDSKNKEKNKNIILASLGIVGGAAAALLAAYAFSAKWVGQMLEPDWARSILFAINGGLTAGIMVMTQKVAKKVEEREDEYQTMIERIDALENRKLVTLGGEGVTIANTSNPNALAVREIPQNQKSSCFQLANGSQSKIQEDKNCSCLATKSCVQAKPIELSKQFKGVNIPGALETANSDFFNSFNSAAVGNIGSGSGLAAGGTNLNALRAARKQLEEEFNEKAEKKVDFDGLQKKTLEKLSGFSRKAILNNGGVSALRNSPAFGRIKVPEDEEEEKKEDEKEEKPLLAEKGKASAQTGGGEAAPEGEENPFANLDFGAGPEGNGVNVEGEEVTSNQALSEYEDSSNDIVDRADEDIFNILTIRYLKSGYPRLLDER